MASHWSSIRNARKRGGLIFAAAVLAVASLVTAATTMRVTAAESPLIVSLVPSFTEDLFAIGAGGQVVGVSQYSDVPLAATKLPIVASSGTIASERIVRLHPDVVVGIPAQASQVADLQRAGVHVVLLRDDNFEDIFRDLEALGKLSGHERDANALERRLRARTTALLATVPRGNRPRCFVVLDTAPIFTVGNRSFIATLIRLAGGRNAAGDLGTAYARYSAEALLALQPDVIITDPSTHVSAVLDRSPWRELRAVREGRLYVLADSGILERPGPRYNDGLAWLIAKLHPNGR
jgi:iron complex transport system substrate-binding protein